MNQTLLTYGSTVLAIALLIGTYLMTHGRIGAGFLYMSLIQIPASSYDIATHQYGFLITGLVAEALYYRGWKKQSDSDMMKSNSTQKELA